MVHTRDARWCEPAARATAVLGTPRSPFAPISLPSRALTRLHATGIFEYFNPLLDESAAVLDTVLQLPATARALHELLGGGAALNQFDFRETPAGAGQMRSGFHHDMGAARTSSFEAVSARPEGQHDVLCQIVYLDDTTEPESPCFAVVPHSHRVPTDPSAPANDATDHGPGGVARFRSAAELHQLQTALGDTFQEVALRGKGGTAIIYDVSLYHARADPIDSTAPSRRRRTMHMYVGRQDGPPTVGWALLPQRLAEQRNPFFSVLAATPMARLFCSVGYSVTSLAAIDTSELTSALGGERWAVHMRRWVVDWKGQVSAAHQEPRLPLHLC
eukprot:COSAG06_NODE_2578_length_6622_cov_18.934386_4_plen_331_part_00